MNKEYFKSFGIIKSNFKKIGIILLFDILFFAVLLVISNWINLSLPKDVSSLRAIFPSKGIVWAALILYFIILILIYSIFKYIIMGNIKSLFGKYNLEFSKFFKFYYLNLIIFVILGVCSLLINLLLGSVEFDFAKYYVILILIPFIILSYVFLNFSHSLFFADVWKKNVIKSLKITFTGAWMNLLLWNLIVLLGYWAIYWLLTFLLNSVLPQNAIFFARFYESFFGGITLVLIYILILCNRIFFYSKTLNTVDKFKE